MTGTTGGGVTGGTCLSSLLDELCEADTAEQKKQWMLRIINDLNAKQHKWLVRVILKDLKIGQPMAQRCVDPRVLSTVQPFRLCTAGGAPTVL